MLKLLLSLIHSPNPKSIHFIAIYRYENIRKSKLPFAAWNTGSGVTAKTHTPLSFLVDVFSSSMSRVCFSISAVYCSTCSLSILIWLSRSWTHCGRFTNILTRWEFHRTQNYQQLHSSLGELIWWKQERPSVRGPSKIKLTPQSSYMTWPRAAMEMEGRTGW